MAHLLGLSAGAKAQRSESLPWRGSAAEPRRGILALAEREGKGKGALRVPYHP